MTVPSCLHTFALSPLQFQRKVVVIIVKCESERRKARGEVLPGNITLVQYSTVQYSTGEVLPGNITIALIKIVGDGGAPGHWARGHHT